MPDEEFDPSNLPELDQILGGAAAGSSEVANTSWPTGTPTPTGPAVPSSVGNTFGHPPPPASPSMSGFGAPPPSAAPTGMTDTGEFGKPGVGETAFGEHGSDLLAPTKLSGFINGQGGQFFGAPGAGEQYWNSVSGSLLQPGNTQGLFGDVRSSLLAPGSSAQAFDQIKRMMPQVSAAPGLDAYYQNAKQRLGEDINNQFSSRGLFNSTPALQGISRGLTDLNAQQAKDEANYNLQRLAEQRGWSGLLSNAGQAADTSRIAGTGLLGQIGGAADQQRLGALGLGGTLANTGQGLANQRMSTLGNFMTADGQLDLNKLGMYLSGALGAQGAARTRGQDEFSNIMGPSAALAGLMGQNYGGLFGQQANSLDSLISALLGKTTDQANFVSGNRQEVMSDIGAALNGGKSLGLLPGGASA